MRRPSVARIQWSSGTPMQSELYRSFEIQRFAWALILCEGAGMKAYSKDLRLRVLAAVDRGMPRREVARTFGLSVSSNPKPYRWWVHMI